jgi:hypothetical protein
MKTLFQICIDNLDRTSTQENDKIRGLMLPRRVNRYLDIVEKARDLYNVSQFLDKYIISNKEDILISGSIQSGKTNELLFYCWWSIFMCRRKVVFVCRNIKADKIQLLDRMKNFNENFIQNEKLFISETSSTSKKKGIVCILANHSQVKTTYIDMKTQKYNLCVDEADLCIKSRQKGLFRLQEYFTHLERMSSHQVGATATEFAVISTKKTLTSVLKLREPKNYYGIKNIQKSFLPLPGVNTHLYGDQDSNLGRVYDNLMTTRDRFCILHTTTKLKIVHASLMTKLRKLYPTMTIITYNGDSSFLMSDDTQEIEDIFKGSKKVKRKVDSRGKYLAIPRSIPLGAILAEVSHHKRICIISGCLASRGLSFVSSDYKLHLTDQYYNPADKVHGESLLQGVRLFGCYNDNPELTLWITSYNWDQIKEQEKLLRRYISKLQTPDSTQNIIQRVEKIKTIFPRKKMSRNSVVAGIAKTITEDGFMNLDIGTNVYDYNEIQEEEITTLGQSEITTLGQSEIITLGQSVVIFI